MKELQTDTPPGGLIPDPKAHALVVAGMMRSAAELNGSKEIANIRMHREQLAIVVAALEAFASSEIAPNNAAPQIRPQDGEEAVAGLGRGKPAALSVPERDSAGAAPLSAIEPTRDAVLDEAAMVCKTMAARCDVSADRAENDAERNVAHNHYCAAMDCYHAIRDLKGKK